ncbi:MAG TPA: F0F1 ATP synthase subunit B' [Methylovirgula sp.]|jgi:F-type H+-transporting ATPase subunit b|nr:F0F1 ATP synthase subunit B' [Methylovirgula sp.]
MATSAEHATTTGTEAPSSNFPPFDPANVAPQLVWLVISFAALYLLMSRLALPRVEGILHDRRSKIQGDVGEAAKKRQAADEAAADYEKTLADAKGRAQALAQQTHAKLAAETDAKRATLEAELSAKIAAGEAEIEALKTKAMASVEQIAQETASAIFEHLTGQKADPKAIAAAVATAKS